MKLSRATRYSSEVLLLLIASLLGPAAAQPSPEPHVVGSLVSNVPADSAATLRAFPRLLLPHGIELDYLGMFSPDAVFRAPSRFGMYAGQVNGEGILPAGVKPANENVPPWMLLSNERVVEDMEPPAHSQATFAAHSRAVGLRDRFVTSVYGRPSVIHAPEHIVSDSQGRVIISDPRANAVHVLDPRGRGSFRILTGKGYRLHVPAGVAVDGEDNIYVADSEHGWVVVFGPEGNFLRYVGSYRGEPEFARLDGIAIDQLRKRLFLVDTPRNLVFELTLDGSVIRRAGKLRNGTGSGEFEAPTDVTVNHTHIFVLDRAGARLQVLDTDLGLVKRVDLQGELDPRFTRDNGLGSDSTGNVYVSLYGRSIIRIYSPEGSLLGTFGQLGARVGEFASPKGLWIDSGNRLYVADAENGRVQIFQIAMRK